MGKPICSKLPDLCPLVLWYENKTSLMKPEVQNMATPSEEDQATVTGNMHKNMVKFVPAVFELFVQTETYRHIPIQYFTTLTGRCKII